MKKFLLSIISLMFSQVFAGTLTVYYPASYLNGQDCIRKYYRPVTYKNVEFLCVTGNIPFFKIDGKRKSLSAEMLWDYTD